MLTIESNGHHTKSGPGRVHEQGVRRKMSKTGRHLMRYMHVMCYHMIGKSPVGSKKGGK